jgi:hypothetical protein
MLVQMDSFDPCSDYYVNAYLNDPDVQRALHANVTRLDHPWSACRSASYMISSQAQSFRRGALA